MKAIEQLEDLLNTDMYNSMEMMVIKEIFDMGLDPFNPNDVKAFWKFRGVDLDAINPSNPPNKYWSYNK